jgi:hypothetical protein
VKMIKEYAYGVYPKVLCQSPAILMGAVKIRKALCSSHRKVSDSARRGAN